MDYIKLGSTDLNVSRICLGTMTWGKQNTQADGFEQMNYALEKGVNFWDTAEMYAIPPTPETYGKTETIIGNWFKDTGRRDEVILASKFSPLPWARGEDVPVINRANIITAVENSLKRLQTEVIDLYQFHWPTNRPNYHFQNWWSFEASAVKGTKQQIIENKIEILETCQELIQQGKIKHIGLSDDSAWGIKQYADLAEQKGLPKMVSIQNEYNLLRRRDEHDVAETCVLEDVAYLPWSPLQMGVISGKYLDGKRPEGARFSGDNLKGNEDRYEPRLAYNCDNAVRAYMDVAEKHGLDVCQMAIAFTLHKKWVASTIIGARTMDQLKSNIDAMDVKLSDGCLADIQKVYEIYPVAM